MTMCRRCIASVGLWLATAVMDSARAQNWNMYQGTTSLQLQYTGGDLNVATSGVYSNNAAKISVNILGNRINGMIIDTGSTGIAISASLLPSLAGYTPLGPGTINYDSSGASPTGTFYELPVSLLGGTSGGSAATASTTVKVLVVTSDNTTTYFGIGNNRNNVYSGTPNTSLTFAQNVAQGIITPISAVGMNPLLNVSVNGTAPPNQGYVVMNNQIVVGLTTANNGYSFVKLTPDAANGPNLWNGIPVSLTVGTGTAGAGTILHDTGIDYAFLTPFGQTGQTVSVAMPGASPTGALYDFVITRGTSTPPLRDDCRRDHDAVLRLGLNLEHAVPQYRSAVLRRAQLPVRSGERLCGLRAIRFRPDHQRDRDAVACADRHREPQRRLQHGFQHLPDGQHDAQPDGHRHLQEL